MSGIRGGGRGRLGVGEGEGRGGATLVEGRDPRVRYRPLILDQNMPPLIMIFSIDRSRAHHLLHTRVSGGSRICCPTISRFNDPQGGRGDLALQGEPILAVVLDIPCKATCSWPIKLLREASQRKPCYSVIVDLPTNWLLLLPPFPPLKLSGVQIKQIQHPAHTMIHQIIH